MCMFMFKGPYLKDPLTDYDEIWYVEPLEICLRKISKENPNEWWSKKYNFDHVPLLKEIDDVIEFVATDLNLLPRSI